MFWPFAIKAMAECLTSLHMDDNGNTPELSMFGVNLDSIPVKNFHTLFCPVYVLDHHLQSAGGPGPPKWEPRSRIGVYLGNSPFHAGSTAFVFNPKTAKASPQYHVIFKDHFTTVPYMERGEVPPNWEDLYCLSKESATDDWWIIWLDSQMDLRAEKSMSIGERHLVPIQEQISNPFNIVPDQRNPAPDCIRADFNPDIGTNLTVASKGECNNLSWVESSFSKAAAVKPLPDVSLVGRVGIKVNLMKDFDAKAATMSSPPTPANKLLIPQHVNLHDLGLYCSKHIAEQQQKEKRIHKAHVTFGSTAKQVLGLFALICMVDTYRISCHWTLLTSLFSDKLIKCFDKANEHCDGTLNDFHFVSLLTDAGSNKVFTYHQAQKQEDWNDFIIAMEKEILDHKAVVIGT
jgi:hypothetical protein